MDNTLEGTFAPDIASKFLMLIPAMQPAQFAIRKVYRGSFLLSSLATLF
jgi:hypothetical protein